MRISSLQRNENRAGSGTAPGHGQRPLIATKIVAPRKVPQRIQRAHLERLLDDSGDRLLTLIKAPAGFGKTALAQSWLERRRDEGDAVAWFSLDSEDEEPRRFLYYLITALHRARPVVGSGTLDLIVEAPVHDILVLLINEIVDCDDELYVFLDDYQLIRSNAVHELLDFILQHAPANLHFVILSHSEPPLGLSSMRARGAVLDIEATQLRFTLEETGEFLSNATGATMAGEARRLYELTQGWPAAVRIASLFAKGAADNGNRRTNLTLASRSIGSYLDELLAAYPVDVVEFATKIAIVDRFNADLCCAITRDPACRSLLEQLQRLEFINVLDDDGTEFAYADLVRDYLRDRLNRSYPDSIAELHRRASTWFESQSLWADSVKQLLAAGDKDEALTSIERCAPSMVQSGDLLTLLSWEQQLHAKLIHSPPRLQLAIAWAKGLSLSRTEADELASNAEAAIAGETSPAAERIRRECLAFRTVTKALADDTEAAWRLGSSYQEQPGDSRLATESLYNAVRYVHIRRADWPNLYRVPLEAQLTEEPARLLTAVYRDLILGIAEFAQGKLEAAEFHYRESLRRGQEVKGFAAGAALAAGPLAELLYERGCIEEADSEIGPRLEVVTTGVVPETTIQAFVTAVRIAHRQGDSSRTLGLLERAESVGLTRGWDRLLAASLFERIRVHRAQDSHAAAIGLARRLKDLRPRRPTLCGVADVAHYACMGAVLASQDPDELRALTVELAKMFDEASASGSVVLAIRLGSVLAVAHDSVSSRTAALDVLHKVIELARVGGVVSSIVDAGPQVGGLLETIARDTGRRDPFVQRLLRESSTLPGDAKPAAAGPPEPRVLLTARERDILELVSAGSSNKVIARELGLAPETVKSHLKNAFAKLEVNRRTQAVLRAKSLGLISGA